MPDPSDPRFDQFDAAARAPGVQKLSVDCFDTLLWRRVPKPTDIHVLVGQRLLDAGLLETHISSKGFARLRSLAEEEARRRKLEDRNTAEVTLEEIYAVLASAVGGHELHLVEYEVEQQNLVADYEVADYLRLLTEDTGLGVIVVSDSYFNQQELRSFLDQPALASVPFERIFTSSDMGTGKGAGLWSEVARELGIAPAQIVHMGDNLEADVRSAERVGIQSFHLPPSTERFTAVEIREGVIGRDNHPSKWCDPVLGDGGVTALRRRSTWARPPRQLDRNEQVAWETGVSVFGPVFTGFGQWVYDQAETVGAERLVFLMREGRFLREFVERSVQTDRWRPSLQTAWISREACSRASIFDGSRAELMKFLERLRPPTPSQLANSFGLDPSDIGHLDQLDSEFASSTDREGLAESFLDMILGQPSLVAKIVERSALRRSRLLNYIRRVAGPGDGPVGLVDVGWSGSIQESLQAMFDRDEEPLDFYGLYLLAHVGSSDRVLRGARLQGYLGTLGTDPFDVAAITGGAEIIELVSTCEEGSLLEIGADDEPILAAPAGDQRESASRELVQAGARLYQERWLSYNQNGPPFFETSEAGVAVLTRILKRFVSQPNHDEALAFSWWLHEENYGSDGTEQLVPLRYRDTLRYRSAEDLHWAPMRDLHWTGGAAALVDHEMSDAIFLMREGTVDPGRFSSPASGLSRLLVHHTDAGADTEYERTIVRNRHGLTHVEWRVPLNGAIRLVVHPANYFALLRLDLLEVVDVRDDEHSTVCFQWKRGQERSSLPATSIRWITTQVMSVQNDSTIIVDFASPLTTREVRVTLAGAFLPPSDVADGHLTSDPEAQLAGLQKEIDDIYRTKLLRVAAVPRRLYGLLRRGR